MACFGSSTKIDILRFVSSQLLSDGKADICNLQQNRYTDYKGNTVSYGYDEPGNVSKTTGIEYGDIKKVIGAEYKYDAANRLISYNGEKVKYDADGNMIYGPLDGGMASYEYDCRNRLVRDGDTTYEYDAEITGLRLILQNKDWKQYRKNMQHHIQQWESCDWLL